MGKLQKCNDCEIIFPSMGNLKSEARIQQHMKARHMVPCKKCDKMFVSITHTLFHRYFSHEPICPHCNQLCERKCSGIFGTAAEKEGRRAMEMMKQESINTVDGTESTVERMIEKLTGGKGEFIQKYASYVDIGYEIASQICGVQ